MGNENLASWLNTLVLLPLQETFYRDFKKDRIDPIKMIFFPFKLPELFLWQVYFFCINIESKKNKANTTTNSSEPAFPGKLVSVILNYARIVTSPYDTLKRASFPTIRVVSPDFEPKPSIFHRALNTFSSMHKKAFSKTRSVFSRKTKVQDKKETVTFDSGEGPETTYSDVTNELVSNNRSRSNSKTPSLDGSETANKNNELSVDLKDRPSKCSTNTEEYTDLSPTPTQTQACR